MTPEYDTDFAPTDFGFVHVPITAEQSQREAIAEAKAARLADESDEDMG